MKKFGKWFNNRIAFSEKIDRSEDVLCSLIHFLGLGMTLGALIPLAFKLTGSHREFWSVLVYGFSMCLMFSTSAIYHGLPQSLAKRVFRFMDHNAIYVLIAGTYTPYASIMGNPGRLLLIIIWMLAGLILFSMFFYGADSSSFTSSPICLWAGLSSSSGGILGRPFR